MLVLWDSACRCSRALLFVAPHPQPPRNRSVAKGKKCKAFSSPAEEGQPLGVWSPQDSSDAARGREGQPEQF